MLFIILFNLIISSLSFCSSLYSFVKGIVIFNFCIFVSVEKVLDLKKVAEAPVSLYTPLGEDDDSLLVDFVPDEEKCVEESVINSGLHDDVMKALSILSEREREVLMLRFGIEGDHPMTLEEIGRILTVTRERIRQIEAKALRKLRHPKRSGNLKSYIRK